MLCIKNTIPDGRLTAADSNPDSPVNSLVLRGSPFAIFHLVQCDINLKTATLGHYRKADRISASTSSKAEAGVKESLLRNKNLRCLTLN